MKKLLGITLIGCLAMMNNVYATPINSVTQESILLKQESSIELVEHIAVQSVLERQEREQLKDKYKGQEGILTKISVADAKLRKLPNAEAEIIDLIQQETFVFVKEHIDNWYLVGTADGEGYIYKTQLDEQPLGNIVHVKSEALRAKETYLGERIVEKAKTYLGNPYTYGGTSLTQGTDCSGFVQQVMKQFDIHIERSSRAQYATNGEHISQSELLPGDLVFYGNGSGVNHVAIYAGGGEIVHASTERTGICMGKLYSGSHIVGMKRVIY